MLELMRKNDFDKLYNLIENSFPRDEYRTYDGQKSLFEKDEYRVFARYDGADLTAFIALWDFDGFAYIEHFAVDEKYRNGGLGAKMLAEIIQKFDKPVCLEVEPPQDDMSRRRINFYRRNGFFLNEYNYVQPALAEGKNEIPLLVMTSGGKVNFDEFDKIREVLYKKVYGKK